MDTKAIAESLKKISGMFEEGITDIDAIHVEPDGDEGIFVPDADSDALADIFVTDTGAGECACGTTPCTCPPECMCGCQDIVMASKLTKLAKAIMSDEECACGNSPCTCPAGCTCGCSSINAAEKLVKLASALMCEEEKEETKKATDDADIQNLYEKTRKEDLEKVNAEGYADFKSMNTKMSSDKTALLEEINKLEASLKTAMPMQRLDMTGEIEEQALNNIRNVLSANKRDLVWKKTIINQGDAGPTDHSKFHTFAIFKLSNGDYAGANAYGRIGYQITVKEIARGSENLVRSKVQSKVRAKLSGRGYVEYE